ncbi:MAG: flagellar protein FlaG [Agathobacter sp.]|nr:flagellar protein FlaG [Agathobacter sp.]
MAIEAIKGAGMTYQGSSASAEVRAEAATKVEKAEIAVTSENIAKETSAINTKQTSGESAGGTGSNMSDAIAAQQAKQAQIKKAVEDINKRAKNSEAIFGVHEDTNRVTIKIVDKQTKEVIKEFPPDKTLDMIAKVWEMAGLMVDEKR